jgi:hypothetical protein
MQEKNSNESKVIIFSKKGKIELNTSEIIDFHGSASVSSFAGDFHLNLKGQRKEVCDSITPKDEIEIWAGNHESGLHKIMAGFIDKIVMNKNEKSEETMEILGRTYEAILIDTKISGKIEFKAGYAEVVRTVLKNSPFIEGELVVGREQGVLIFHNISVMELIQNILEDNAWVFILDYDKKYSFLPKMPEKVHNLEKKDIRSYKFVKQ